MATTALQITRITNWRCPNCGATDQTNELRPHSRMHVCPALMMMTAPMVQEGVSAKIVIKEREDYINGDRVQLFGEKQRPIMAMHVVRDDGYDTRVYAPTATGFGEAKEISNGR